MKKTTSVILVIFGVSGDLSQRYLLPAIGELALKNKLPKDFRVIGITRKTGLHLDDLLEKTTNKKYVREHGEIYSMDTEKIEDYRLLHARIEEIKKDFGGNSEILFYLSLPPSTLKSILKSLHSVFVKSKQTAPKILLEKPFGVNLQDARKLSDYIHNYFNEKSLYRIDHYLAKKSVAELITYRQSSPGKKIWNKSHIKNIEVYASEAIGIEKRADFYDQTGALKDMVQSHLLELLSLTLMREPEKSSNIPLLRYQALKKISLEINKAKRGQYEGYKKEVENPKSTTETFVSLQLKSSDNNYRTIPFSITTGKALESKFTEIRIILNQNKKTQEERILTFKEDPSMPYNSYERILFDAINSQKELFISSKEVIETWRILEPLQKKWQKNASNIFIYKKGTSLENLK